MACCWLVFRQCLSSWLRACGLAHSHASTSSARAPPGRVPAKRRGTRFVMPLWTFGTPAKKPGTLNEHSSMQHFWRLARPSLAGQLPALTADGMVLSMLAQHFVVFVRLLALKVRLRGHRRGRGGRQGAEQQRGQPAGLMVGVNASCHAMLGAAGPDSFIIGSHCSPCEPPGSPACIASRNRSRMLNGADCYGQRCNNTR